MTIKRKIYNKFINANWWLIYYGIDNKQETEHMYDLWYSQFVLYPMLKPSIEENVDQLDRWIHQLRLTLRDRTHE